MQNLKPKLAFEYAVVPFDIYCPSVKEKREKGVCKKFNIIYIILTE